MGKAKKKVGRKKGGRSRSLWAQAIKEGKCGIPRKGSEAYDMVKKIHERLKKEAAAEAKK